MLDSIEHDRFKRLPVLPGSAYKCNTNQLVRLSLEIPIPRSIQCPRKLGHYFDLGIGISRESPPSQVSIIIRMIRTTLPISRSTIFMARTTNPSMATKRIVLEIGSPL